MKFSYPPDTEMIASFNTDDFVRAVEAKMPKGKGLAPKDMVSLCQITYMAGVKAGIDYCNAHELVPVNKLKEKK